MSRLRANTLIQKILRPRSVDLPWLCNKTSLLIKPLLIKPGLRPKKATKPPIQLVFYMPNDPVCDSNCLQVIIVDLEECNTIKTFTYKLGDLRLTSSWSTIHELWSGKSGAWPLRCRLEYNLAVLLFWWSSKRTGASSDWRRWGEGVRLSPWGVILSWLFIVDQLVGIGYWSKYLLSSWEAGRWEDLLPCYSKEMSGKWATKSHCAV